MRKPRFELFASDKGGWTFRLKSPNWVVMLNGRTYETKHEALHAIASLMRYGKMQSQYKMREEVTGGYCFRIYSPAGVLLGWSNTYETKRDREIAMRAVILAVTTGRVSEGS